MQKFRLSPEPHGLGLSCGPSGLSLAGVPLLHKSKSGLIARPLLEVSLLLRTAYGEDCGLTTLHSSLGLIADALNRASIRWGKGINDQNGDWEGVLAEENPEATRLAPPAKTFDLHNKSTGEAISAKTLNIQTYGYSKNPQRIFSRLKGYVDATADHQPRTSRDVNPDLIRSGTIQLAVPEYIAPEQWRYLHRAIRYGRERGVRLVITRIRD